jgi:5-methyltetrahydropteroyltriglutamate--homocysteine methyltransferase
MTVNPPFRADIVGSFLRSQKLKDARARHEAGTLDDAGLREVEDAEIVRVVARQADAGLQLATDGEFRRSWWHFDFFDGLEGVEIVDLDHGIQFQGVQTRSRGVRVDGPIGFPADHPMIEHYRFLQSRTSVLPKMTIPAPTVLHFRLRMAP